MNKSSHSILTAIFLLLLISSCKDELPDYYVPGLPLPTEKGNHVIGCLINEEPWQNDARDFFEVLNVWYDEDGSNVQKKKWFDIDASNRESQDGTKVSTYLDIEIYPLESEGTIHPNYIHEVELTRIIKAANGNIQSNKTYHLDAAYNNYLEVTKLDTIANICAGRFSLRLIKAGNFDTLLLSEGRFDFKYREQY